MKTTVLSEGSVPPVFEWFGCIRKLDDKPFSNQLIQNCVSELKTNSFIREVKVSTREQDEGRWVSVDFVLSSDSLIVDELSIKTFDGQESAIWKMLLKNDTNLRVGGIYNWSAESSAYFAITFLYRAQGKLVGVIPEVKLDYKQGKAQVDLQVIEGPSTLKHPLSPPYGEWCDDRVRYVDWSESNDGVPFDLIESGLALASPFTCFSDELAQRDKTYLSNLPFLSASSVEYSGPFGDRTIRYKLKAKPLKVEKIIFRGYGYVPSNLQDGRLLNTLSQKTGELFSRWAVQKSAQELENTYKKDGYWAEVRVQEELAGGDAIRVTFSVLRYPLQTVVVDGHELQSTKEDANNSYKPQ